MPVTRFRTALEALCWMKRVASVAPMEKLCQLMMAFGLLVMVSVLPCWEKVAWPLTTAGPVGLACTTPPKADATARQSSRCLKVAPSTTIRLLCFIALTSG